MIVNQQPWLHHVLLLAPVALAVGLRVAFKARTTRGFARRKKVMWLWYIVATSTIAVSTFLDHAKDILVQVFPSQKRDWKKFPGIPIMFCTWVEKSGLENWLTNTCIKELDRMWEGGRR
jgi:hypothetical protein